MKKAIFAGSFDPFHKGHLSIAQKAAKLFDHLYISITINPEKPNRRHTFIDRKQYILKQVKHIKNVEVIINKNEMTANLAKKLGVKYLVRSARSDEDFTYEMEIASANNHLNTNLETILFIPDYETIDFRSRLIKQTIKKDKV